MRLAPACLALCPEVTLVKHVGLFAALLALACPLWAQDAPQEEEYEVQTAYVRRLSVGVTGTAIALMLLRGGVEEFQSLDPVLYSKYETNPKEHYVGGGLNLQLALFDRWTLNGNWLYKTAEYESFKTFLAGVDDPKTVRDERVSSGETEVTKARYFDFPVLLRRYNIGRFEYGNRWFIEGGPSLRYVSKIRTKRELNPAEGDNTTDYTPAGHRKSLLGVTAGFGGQFIDPVGVRLIPEVRYTRWLGATFDAPPTRSRRDQLEFLISISF